MGWRGESVRYPCQLSQALIHILILCLFILDKEDIQPIDSHKKRLETRRRQQEAATSLGSWPCSLASASPTMASPSPLCLQCCEFAAIVSPSTATPLGAKGMRRGSAMP